MLPSSSRVSLVTYHSVVAVRYPDLCRLINDMWELGSFAPEDFQTSHQGSSSSYGTQMLELMASCDRPRDARVPIALAFPHECRVRRWALRDDHCHRSQEQPQPFSAQERLCPHAPRRNNRQLSRRNSTGSNRSPAEYWIPDAKYYTNGSPRKTRKTALAASLSDSPAQNPNRIGLPAGHDGAHGHGSSCRDYCIWHPRPSKRRNAWDWPNFNADPEQENLAQINR